MHVEYIEYYLANAIIDEAWGCVYLIQGFMRVKLKLDDMFFYPREYSETPTERDIIVTRYWDIKHMKLL